MNISLIKPSEVPVYWKDAEAWLKPSVDRSLGRHTLADILNDLLIGQQQLWVVHDGPTAIGAMTSAINTYPHKRYLTLVFVGGIRFSEWMTDLDDMLEQFAVAMGCDAIETTGRKGFKRVLDKIGYTQTYYVYEKDIDRG